MASMEDNPFRSPNADPDDKKPQSFRAKALLALCVVLIFVRTLMLAVGGLRVLVVPERRENMAAVAMLIIWPTFAVAVWVLGTLAVWSGKRLMAAICLAIGACDLIALMLTEPPIDL